MKTIGFIGGGRITRILLQAFKNANVVFEHVYVFENNAAVIEALKSKFPEIEVSDVDSKKAASSDLVFLALHPPVLVELLPILATAIKTTSLVVSLAPKITIQKLHIALPLVQNIARMNPNAGTYVNKGYNPVCFAESFNGDLKNAFLKMFEKVGKVPVVAETQMEAYAVISAMGHTYFWFQLQQIKELALTFGLSETQAQETITAMLWGTSETLFHSGLPYHEVADLVPVKPMASHEDSIKQAYANSLKAMFEKIKPQ